MRINFITGMDICTLHFYLLIHIAEIARVLRSLDARIPTTFRTRGQIRASSVAQIHSGNPLASAAVLPQGTARDPSGRCEHPREMCLSSSYVNGKRRELFRVCGRKHDEELEGVERWYGEAEASGGKYSRFQGNRVMTQFRKDR